ncbi:MAG: GntR family transcriptional regulator [Anaerolineaceae bacterium]|nr:GntR family transcriptional regulator [Anaerolineaceae bacterium]
MSRRTLTDSVYEGLLRRLAEGQWAEGQRLPVVRQLETEFGVSRVTVLSAMRRAAERGVIRVRPRHFTSVAPQAAEQATQLLADLHSRPGKRRVAMLWPEHLGPGKVRFTFGQLLEQDIGPAAARKDIELELVEWPHTDQAAFVEKIIRRGFAAALAFGVNTQMLASMYEFRRRRFPVMTFNRHVPETDVPSILLDEQGGSRKIASALAALGHRNLCLVYMAFDNRLREGEQRVNSWIDYLARPACWKAAPCPSTISSREKTSICLSRCSACRTAPRPWSLGMPTCGTFSSRVAGSFTSRFPRRSVSLPLTPSTARGRLPGARC